LELKSKQARIVPAVDAAAQEIISISHQIHDHPELGYQEVFASNLLASTLEAHGFSVERGFAGMPTAFRARKGRGGGPRVAILAEYDALPEIGHGCGHNVIATSALGAGIGLGAVIDEVPGEVWVIGTPAEETDGGKVVMAGQGVFNEVDVAMMVHPSGGNYTLTHSLAMDAIQVEYFGAPAHAAVDPWNGRNALDALILLFSSLNALRQQIRPDARIHGIITRGGAAPNIIPDYTAARFYVRARERAYLDGLVEKFKACAQSAALSTGTRVEFSNYENSFDDMVSNVPLSEKVRDYMLAMGAGSFKDSRPDFGSADMGNVSHIIPAIHTMISISSLQEVSPHTREFCAAAVSPEADRALIQAGKSMALAGLDLLADPEFLARTRQGFAEQLGYKPARS
jgi:amidohydrolase